MCHIMLLIQLCVAAARSMAESQCNTVAGSAVDDLVPDSSHLVTKLIMR